ncbi:sugar phosphate isomerase/epimerase [Blautia liquoris]|uniref:Sugar phosphate isomerase/epimerase n=1 Tax=Blautia liquoris TaxID=2779518 RepID=A0A7M2REQ4_9FIRM|nr:sugar phosphate isomerase/epimerase family protein [Blautia liquoris]QOV18806.1 sugar phosphate isomerase/epimerase [Blautia liquoris]
MMIATTGCLQAGSKAPIVYRGAFEDIFPKMAADGYQAVEMHIQDSREINREKLNEQLEINHLKLTSIGTGMAYGTWHLNIGDHNRDIRNRAIACIEEHMITASPHHSLVILGSMQGRFSDAASAEEFVSNVEESLYRLDQLAKRYNVLVGYEIMNHYESDFLYTIADGVRFMEEHDYKNIRLHIDTVHMNIDESDMGRAIRAAGSWIQHVHIADNDRYYPGHGHLSFREILQALRDINYEGALALETYNWPETQKCARKSREYLEFMIEEVYGQEKEIHQYRS